jgi:hypothetical protein
MLIYWRVSQATASWCTALQMEDDLVKDLLHAMRRDIQWHFESTKITKQYKAYIWNDVPYSRVNDNYSYLFIENDQFDIHCFCLNSWKSRLGIAISARGNPRALCFFPCWFPPFETTDIETSHLRMDVDLILVSLELQKKGRSFLDPMGGFISKFLERGANAQLASSKSCVTGRTTWWRIRTGAAPCRWDVFWGMQRCMSDEFPGIPRYKPVLTTLAMKPGNEESGSSLSNVGALGRFSHAPRDLLRSLPSTHPHKNQN